MFRSEPAEIDTNADGLRFLVRGMVPEGGGGFRFAGAPGVVARDADAVSCENRQLSPYSQVPVS